MSKTAARPRRRRAKASNGVQEQTLVDVPPEEIDGYEFRFQGASGFKGGKELNEKDEITVTVGGRVIGVETRLRRRHESGVGSVEEERIRIVTIKATGAFIRDATKDETKTDDDAS